jgi:hypothetical protein
MCKKTYAKYACGCIGRLIDTEICGLLEAADDLRNEGQDPSGDRIRNLEHACKQAERKVYKVRDFKCPACFAAMHA